MLNILIADDEMIERKYLKQLFEKFPSKFCVTAEASTGQAALELALLYKPDIIIMDISMPVLNGLDAAAMIKKKLPHTKILLNTAYAEFEFAQKAVSYHLDAYLLKPSSEDSLLNTIESCLSGKSAKQKGLPPSKSMDTPMTAPVAKYIQQNYQQNLTLKELSDFIHFSPSYLSHLFHEEHGMTITVYINQQRINYAVSLLTSSTLSVKAICSDCGFTNISHFNRVFKKHMGQSPAELRKGNER